jgi:hypothetical protein
VETPHSLDEWAHETIDGRRIFNAGFQILGDELPDWQLIKAVPMETSRRGGELAYIWQQPDGTGRALLRLQIAELPDWRLAQRRLREDLEMSMRPNIPRGTGHLASIGDIAFVARDPESDIPGAISFARGNIFSSVRSVGDEIVDVSAAAEWLDRAIGQPPSKSELADARLEARTLEAAAREAGEERVIIDSIGRASDGGWLKVLASEGELRRQGDSLIYLAGAAGPARVETFVKHSSAGRSDAQDRRPDHGGMPA